MKCTGPFRCILFENIYNCGLKCLAKLGADINVTVWRCILFAKICGCSLKWPAKLGAGIYCDWRCGVHPLAECMVLLCKHLLWRFCNSLDGASFLNSASNEKACRSVDISINRLLCVHSNSFSHPALSRREKYVHLPHPPTRPGPNHPTFLLQKGIPGWKEKLPKFLASGTWSLSKK